MGEQLSDGGRAGRRRAHPGGTPSGPHGAGARPDLEALLAAAMRPAIVDAEGERRAVDAFRAARDAGTHRARTRRRDDWRPRAWRRTVRSLRVTLSLLGASLALGGVAFATIGTSGSSSDAGADDGTATPSAGASTNPGAGASSATAGPGHDPTDRPETAQDIEAQCRAYAQVSGNGKALDSVAWQRLLEAAGTAEKVDTYCAAQLAEADKGKGRDDASGNGGDDASQNGGDNANDKARQRN
ncbi:hypothetical protein BN159_3534 [Streptomyces davaonensis JCM 4913]|uniref:Uncharacterized protein n=1 Tax=Streptomyces davaonensis (strain DSM 101723 / JCM 4913 / KCC S-0913 / 768) TaxID=1214101 RepID=K4R3K5_STRDJ|nr:hypothetical protein [Streptomyces davaonensis]CCK27913.1 hypothetical protein BN159_3534 [Streptomyces davaonensis JCM 4913]